MALMMVLAISGTLSVLAGNRLVLNDGGPIAIKPGETKEITVNLVNDEVIYAMQFDMDFTSPQVEIVPGSFKINEERIDRECFIATMIQQPDAKWRVALLTKDFTPIAGTEGALGTFKIRATPNFSDDKARIGFSTCSGSDRQGKKVLIDCPFEQAITPMVGSLSTGEQAFSIKPGGTHKVDVVLKNDIYFCGLQADITLPEGLHVEKKSNGKMIFQYSERLSSNFAIFSSEKNGIVRVALSSLPIDKIQPYKDGNGVIFSFNVVADPDFATDETSAIVFSNVLASQDLPGTEYALDITDAHIAVTSLKPINEAAYARLTEEVAALQKALDDAKAKVAEECPDVAGNYAETVETIQSLINAIQSDLDAKNADCALTEASTLDAEAVKGVNDAIAKYINEAAAAQAEHLKKLANEAAYVRLTEAVATLQARFDEVKATIEKDYANVSAQFVDTEAAIQGDIDQKKAELQAQYEAVKLDENSTIDLEAIKAAVEKLLADAKAANAKLVANEAAYVRLSDDIAAVQARFDEVKATIEKDYANVSAQFVDTEAAIQGDIDQKKAELQAQYEAVKLDENSTIDLEAIKAAVEKLLADAKAANAKLVANEAAYVRLSDDIAAVQARFDEVKATIEKDYANVSAQFVDTEAAIQGDIDQKKAELQAQYEAVKLDENSTIDLEAIKAAVEKLLADAKAANAKLVANEAAYVRLSDDIAAVQARFDEVKATIEKDYANVSAQFVDTEAAIQGDIDQKKAELQAQYEAVKLDENSTIDLEAIKAAVEKLLADAKAANAKLVANEAAYVRLSDDIAAVQARFDEVKATIEKDYANVAAQFADAEAAIQADIDQKKAELQAQYEAVELDENSTIGLEAIKAAVEQLLEDAKAADAKLVANEAAYVRLSDEIAAVQTRLDEVKATIEKDYAIVAAQFVGVESSIQYDINKKKDELKAQYEAVELDENSTIDLETIKTAIEQLLADAKAAAEANSIGSIQRLMSEGATFYTLGGQKVEAPCKGNIYMIRHADGSVKKVYIK